MPKRGVGIFWLGGLSLAFKGPAQCVHVVDPAFSDREDEGPVGVIDVRPDMVLCTLKAPDRIDLSTLTHMAAAFPEARFVASARGREWMIGRGGRHTWDEAPIDPRRVYAIGAGERLDVRKLGVRDLLKVQVLSHDDEQEEECSRNALLNFAGIHICLARDVATPDGVDRLCEAVGRQVDVLIWPVASRHATGVCEAVSRLRPRYVVAVGYDGFPGGRTAARRFREAIVGIGGAKVYLFPEDYLEGLVYSRIMRRRR